MPTYHIARDAAICTCGVGFRQHKSGRCADKILHRLLYDEEPSTYPAGTMYTDGTRDLSLFQDDLLIERGDDKYLVPQYTHSPAEAMILIAKWHDMGGTGQIHINRTGFSGQFRHGAIRGYYRGSNMVRTRLEWLPIRALAVPVIEFLRESRINDCDWINGVDPVVPDPA